MIMKKEIKTKNEENELDIKRRIMLEKMFMKESLY